MSIFLLPMAYSGKFVPAEPAEAQVRTCSKITLSGNSVTASGNDNNNNGNWAKIYEYTDAGGWGNQGAQRGGDPDQIITWGGPVATFRWDSATDVDIKNFSGRVIQPPL